MIFSFMFVVTLVGFRIRDVECGLFLLVLVVGVILARGRWGLIYRRFPMNCPFGSPFSLAMGAVGLSPQDSQTHFRSCFYRFLPFYARSCPLGPCFILGIGHAAFIQVSLSPWKALPPPCPLL